MRRSGTVNTIAPECIVQEEESAAPEDAAAVDVWGLGVTLYITLVGTFPFQVGNTSSHSSTPCFASVRLMTYQPKVI